MPVSTNTDLPSKYPMKSLPENLKFDTANLKFAMSRDQIFLKNCKKIYIWYKQENKYALGSKEIPVVFSFLFLKASLLDAVADLPWIIFMPGPYTSRAGWWISEVCAYRVRLKHLYIETTVQKDFAQNSIFWKINFKPKIPYLRN